MLTGLLGESWIRLSEFGLVAGRLLQVEAEDLVQLDQVFAFLVEPGGQALVQLGSRRLGQGVVGGVSEQQVAEAEGASSPGSWAVSGRIRPFRTSAARRGVTGRPSERACTAPRWKISPSTAPRSSTERSLSSS